MTPTMPELNQEIVRVSQSLRDLPPRTKAHPLDWSTQEIELTRQLCALIHYKRDAARRLVGDPSE